MISFLVTAWKEPKTIAKCIRSIADRDYAGFQDDFEVLLACPDEETLVEAQIAIKELGIEDKFHHIQDPGNGKPIALTMLMDAAKGDVWVLTDGDAYCERGAIRRLLSHFENPETQAVTGRPKSADEKNNMMGYFGHLLADAAHHKRTIDLTESAVGYGAKFVKKRPFFPVSGYLYAMRPRAERVPPDCLVDDAYLSYIIYNSGGKIAYEPGAIVYIKYATTLSDYMKQKKRSVGGYVQLWQYGIVKAETNTRSFFTEAEYFWFPFKYARNLRELWWSILLYPIRVWLWVEIFWERRVLKKDFSRTWVRIESTK